MGYDESIFIGPLDIPLLPFPGKLSSAPPASVQHSHTQKRRNGSTGW